jgi:hypothetical protein
MLVWGEGGISERSRRTFSVWSGRSPSHTLVVAVPKPV